MIESPPHTEGKTNLRRHLHTTQASSASNAVKQASRASSKQREGTGCFLSLQARNVPTFQASCAQSAAQAKQTHRHTAQACYRRCSPPGSSRRSRLLHLSCTAHQKAQASKNVPCHQGQELSSITPGRVDLSSSPGHLKPHECLDVARI